MRTTKDRLIIACIEAVGPCTKPDIVRICGRRYIDKNLAYLVRIGELDFDGVKFSIKKRSN